ncbi:saccharopine dehydrogenase NADP-binding domain-containing protein [Pseudomonas sp. LFM046]|uniref:homospermidine synthase n=1 Tax=Pseudomonas sp. LFM046 TaxID=1608357 RepID=UPI0005CFCFA2|nr:saccharopine dehydrogenase NADP-binding domain-containing protein [Pseudomonas sp. LFM046]
MHKTQRLQRLDGRLVMVGFGCIGQGVLPLLLRHLNPNPDQLLVLSAEAAGQSVAEAQGITFRRVALAPDNYRETLAPLLGPGDFLLNLSVGVSTLALLEFCRERDVLYLDTCIEPWPGGYTDPQRPLSQRTNHALREAALALRRPGEDAPTALLTHGANPGLVSHLVKQALLNLAKDCGESVQAPIGREAWAALAEHLGVRCIHIAERDSQQSLRRKQDDEFVNTWSIAGFIAEACQPAELGWGSHERNLPPDGHRHERGCQAAIYLRRPGAATQVRTWTPSGPTLGYLITHGESISMADYFTLGPAESPRYRPTVLYAYQPCDDAVLSLRELAARNWQPQRRARLLLDDITSGHDDLGVLLLGHGRQAYWFGSRLSIEQARALCPHNNATSLQVTASVLAGVVWTLRNPRRGILEPDELPYADLLELARPYLGELMGFYTDWTPLQGRERLVAETLDRDDPWQFVNVRA